jgi:hypothetical protein
MAMAMIPDNSRGILVHTCCAWCLLDVLGPLSRDYGRIVVGFFNPNIHPRAEFEKRMKSARLLCRRLELELVCDGQYGLVPFLNSLYNARRCSRAPISCRKSCGGRASRPRGNSGPGSTGAKWFRSTGPAGTKCRRG